MKITPQVRSNEKRKRLQALRIGATYSKRLDSARLKELTRVLKLAESVPVDKWEEELPKRISERYLKKWYSDLVIGVGLPAAREAVNEFMGQKAAPYKDIWEEALQEWIKANSGRKIKIISSSFKDWFRGAVKEAIKDKEGIEFTTQSLLENVMNHYMDVKEWQIRRIVQTESLTALSVAQAESIDALGIPYIKTWGISGNNTRPAHIVMDGVSVNDDEMFNVDGELLAYPRDARGSAGNVINCACFVIRRPKGRI